MAKRTLPRFTLPAFAGALFLFAVVSVVLLPGRNAAAPLLPPPASPYPATVAGVGVIEPESEAIDVGTNIAGVVSKVHVKAGDVVASGAPLFTIDERPTDAALALARAELASSEVASADARDQFLRYQRIKGSDGISDSELARRRFAAELAEGRVGEARARVAQLETEKERLTVTAPIAARIWRVNVRPGEFAPAGPLTQPLVVVGADNTLHVRVEVDQTDASRVRPEAKAVGSLRGDGASRVALTFVRFEPLVQPKRALTGDGNERIDTRVLEVIYKFDPKAVQAFVGQQMDVFIEAAPRAATPALAGDPAS